MTLHRGKNIIRARSNGVIGNGSIEPSYTNKSDYLYKPANANKTYQRASTPNRTMLYGVAYPDDQNEMSNLARTIATFETSKLLWEGKSGEEKISYGRFVVTDDIPLIAICYQSNLATRTEHSKSLYETFEKGLAGVEDSLRTRSIAVTEFLADQFAKAVGHLDSHTRYMISAIFSEMVVNNGKAGIYYPSVKNVNFPQDLLFNVAISPEYSDNNLKLLVAGECTIYSEKGNVFVDNDAVCSVKDDTIPFAVVPIENDSHVGREEVYKKWGINKS